MSSSPPLTSNLMKSNTNGQKIDTELLKPNSLSSSSTTTVAASNGTVSIMNTCNNKMIEDDANSLLVNNGDNTFIISSSADVEVDENDVLIDHYPGITIDQELSSNSSIENDDDDDNDRCTVISVPVGNLNSSTSSTKPIIGKNNLLSMQTFVTNHNNNNVNNIDHPNKVNINSCDQENYSIDKDNDDYDNEDDDDDDDDDADRTLKSNRKIPDPNDRFYHHHPHYNNNNDRFRIEKNMTRFIDIKNIDNDNDGDGDDDDKKMIIEQYQSYPNNLKQKMTTFMINGPVSSKMTTTATSNDENYSKIKNAAIINNNNRQNQNLNVIINGDSSIESSSSSPIQQQQPNTSPIFVDLNNKLSNTTMIESVQTANTSIPLNDSSTIFTKSSRLMPITEQSLSTIDTATTTNSISVSPQSSSSSTTATTTTNDNTSASYVENIDTTNSTSSSPSSSSSSTSILNVNHTNHQSFGEPIIILTKKENSCHFIERRISLATQKAKVGRSIGRTSTSLNNAIFDCKVLSRNHALFWYEDGKFYLKDTCSSNGTFVNGHRLSTTNERSLPQVVYSGDCIQFGVEVTEKKNVHSCVIATIRLFHPDGTEATKDHNHRLLADGCFDDGDRQFLLNYPNSSIQIPPSQLIDLVCQIHQSVQKQRLLEQQLDSTRQIMKEALDSAKNGWRSLVEEDRFLSRIQTLQAQLEVCLIAKNRDSPESSIIEALKQNNLKLIADKEKFEQESKCSLQKALENKILTETNLQTAKTRLNAKIDECRLLQESLDSNVKELKCLAQNCDKLKKEKDELMAKMKRLEDEDMKLKQQKFANNSGQQMQQQVVAVKKSTTSTNTILPIMLDQNVQTMIDVDDEKQVRKLSENHQQTQTDYRNESVDVRDSTSIEPKQYEQVKNFLLNHYEQMEICNQSIVKQLSMIDDLIDEKLKSMDTTIIRVQSIIDEIVKNLQRKNQQCSSLLRQQNESLQQQIDENNKLKCDIQCLHIQLQESNREHQTNDGSINNILKLEKSIQVEQQQIEPKLLMATTQNNEDLQQQQTSSSSKMLMLKHLTMAIDVEDDDGDETVAIQNDEQIDCDNIDQILMKKMDKLIQRNQILMANNECLNQEIESLKEKHDLLSLQNQVSLGIAVLPLFVIFVCFVLVLYQPLSFITGTFGL
ncbi:sarcolemma associated protein [Dermatophagoides farinae]|uniref:sarcolemma associated protein n=1 Tax=Dermatophagoides farinae TaxID=6954 RepID=UPI003F63B8E3